MYYVCVWLGGFRVARVPRTGRFIYSTHGWGYMHSNAFTWRFSRYDSMSGMESDCQKWFPYIPNNVDQSVCCFSFKLCIRCSTKLCIIFHISSNVCVWRQILSCRINKCRFIIDQHDWIINNKWRTITENQWTSFHLNYKFNDVQTWGTFFFLILYEEANTTKCQTKMKILQYNWTILIIFCNT